MFILSRLRGAEILSHVTSMEQFDLKTLYENASSPLLSGIAYFSAFVACLAGHLGATESAQRDGDQHRLESG